MSSVPASTTRIMPNSDVACRFWTNSSSPANYRSRRRSLSSEWLVSHPVIKCLGRLLNVRIYRSLKQTALKSKRTAKTRWHGWAVSAQEARRGCIPSAVISPVHIHTITYFIMSGCCFYLREVCGGISDLQCRKWESDRRYPVQRGEQSRREQSRAMR